MAQRLPTPGGDNGDWGDILNSFLEVSLASSGALNVNTVGTAQIQNNAVTNAQLDTATQAKMAGALQAANNLNDVASPSTARNSLGITPANIGAVATSQVGANNGVAQLDSSGKLVSAQLPSTVINPGSPVTNEGLIWNGSSWSNANLASTVEITNTVASSGPAQTLPDPATAGSATLNRITLTANCTITLPTPQTGKSLTLITVQDGTGGRTITLATPSGVIKWPGGSTPTYSSGASAVDVTTFVCADGTNWLGMPAGYSFA
jgi:hypothetical protein